MSTLSVGAAYAKNHGSSGSSNNRSSTPNSIGSNSGGAISKAESGEPDTVQAAERQSKTIDRQLAAAKRELADLPYSALSPAELETMIVAARNDPATSDATLLALVEELHRAEIYHKALQQVTYWQEEYDLQMARNLRLQTVADRGKGSGKSPGGILSIFK